MQDNDNDIGIVPGPVQPRRRRNAMARVFSSLFMIALAALVVAGIAAFIGFREFTAPGPLADKKVFEIARGLDTPQIAAQLQEQGIISDSRIFSGAAFIGGLLGGKLKAGEYEFPANATMEEVVGIISSGRAITYKVSIPEGFTSEMAVNRLRENDVLAGEIVTVPPEGTIMPDTYVFKRGMTRQKLLEDMQAAGKKLIDELWQGRAPGLQLKTREEAVTLASMVEKETGRPEERPEIAGVFLNRLQKGMRLQSDPTIIYGISGGKGKLDRPITKADIAAPTPYNTYVIDGLPPGPIANPGRAALEAVMNPPATNNLFFVADGTGGHAFAATLDEHNANVAKWRAGEVPETAVAAAEPAAPATAPAAAEPPAANLSGVLDPPPDAAPAAPPADQPATAAVTPPPVEDMAQPVPAPAPAPAPAAQPAEPPQQTASADQPPPVDTLKPEEKKPELPKPVEKKPEPPKADDVVNAKPGTVLRVANRLVPIPVLKPARKK